VNRFLLFIGAILATTSVGIASDYNELVAGTINFKTGKSGISASQRQMLSDLAPRLKRAKKVLLIGHADKRGDRLFNLELADKRASTVRTALYKFGVKSDITMTFSYGEEKPIAPNDRTPDHLAANRSVEIVVIENNKIIHRNRVFLIGGGGPHTLGQTNKGDHVNVDWEYKPVGGIGYQRLLTDRFSLGVVGLSNSTFGLTLGYDF